MSTEDTVTHQPSLHCATSTTAEEPVEKTSIEKQSRTAPTGWRVPSGNVLLAFTVGIAAAALFYIVPQSSPSNFASSSKSHPRGLTMDNTSVPLPPKYQSDIVAMTPRTLLFPDASCDPPSVAYPSGHNYGTDSFVSIEYALDQDLRLSGHVLLLLNGDNHGLLFEWFPSDGGSSCLFELAEAAASMLGADSALFPNGLRLYNLDGHPIASAADLDQGGRVAYILTDFQLWVWPGIAVGYSRVVDSSVTLTTLSLSPLVFDVEHFFQSNEADVIIADGGRHLERSPVVGAEDGSDYDDDRTSFTGFLNDSALTRDFQRRTARLARLPSPSFVERLQLVRYEQGQWFRRHEDYYDSKDFANRKRTAAALYADWLEFLRRQGGDDQEDGEENGLAKVPPVTELAAWELTLLAAFLEDAAATDLFARMGATDWKEYLYAAANENNHKAVQEFIQEKGMVGLHLVIQSYERRHPHGEPYKYESLDQGVIAVT
ncbi:hypothetical protein B5M09_002787 [Aphanomyces astaci]|uniref:Prolyl 4-hydroxylase alpha subunit domain-containing protein n=1 Tax=Aphanomyces astaci TaxID=112090 RepID=A0A425DDT2_APHAT|nr:hypothetical protein B5M09_002787 [Aphanomyces astaci]